MVNKSLEERVELMEAVHKIENLINRYEYKLGGGRFEEVVELFAQKTPGVRAEIGCWGVYDGIEGIRRCYLDFHKYTGKFMHRISDKEPEASGYGAGIMFTQTNTTPVIEVAGDGKTAKGVWICPGHMTMPMGEKLQAYWGWCKRGVDFVKEDGEWKIWHYHVYGIFSTPYEKSWVEWAETGDANAALDISWLPDKFKADKPSTYHWIYTPITMVEYVPAAPEPYETFNEKTAY